MLSFGQVTRVVPTLLKVGIDGYFFPHEFDNSFYP